jgi:Methyltransferase domain
MFYLEFLRALHERLEPRTYLEIGMAQGHSLALSRCASVGIDPAFCVDQEIACPVSLLRCTSDEYFARLSRDGSTPFGELPVDLSYIDGMHHFEYALRDFVGAERYSAPSSVIAFDDVLPRDVEEAARDRDEMPWTGDVFRIPIALKAHRPDLLLLMVDTEPAGTLLVAKLDPSNRALANALDDIVRDYVMPDPQSVPPEILDRTGAMLPENALALPLWEELKDLRAAKRA